MDATLDDSVQKVLERYPGMVHYRRHGPDAGQAAAIQEGWDHTGGEIVAWLCADDYYYPYTLAEVDKIFVSHPEIDVVYGDSLFVDRDDNFLSYFPAISRDISLILQGCCISQPSCFVRRSALRKVGKLDSSLHYIMDWDLWVRLYESGATFHYLHKPLSVVRMYSDTKTGSGSKKRYGEINAHLRRHVGFVRRLMSLSSFYCYDLLTRKSSMANRIVFNLLRSIKNALLGRSTMSGALLYGFEVNSNTVHDACEILLPLYGRPVLGDVVVECHGTTLLHVHINDHLQEVNPTSDSDDYCRYVLKKQALSGNLLKIRLYSPSAKPWQLLALKVVVDIFSDHDGD
jgi:glycosyltransferase involved in cell wall biosynthesis